MIRGRLGLLATIAAGLVLALGCWSSVGATTWYVDQNNANASDAGPGTASQPFKTLGKGTSVAVAGDTVQVNSGRYYEAVTFAHAGTATQPITLKALPGQRAIVDGGLVLSSASWVQCDSSYSTRNANYANIYHIDFSTQSGSRPISVYQDDNLQTEAVWPAFGWCAVPINGATSTPSTNPTGASTLTDSLHLTQSDGYWVGGRIIYYSPINYLTDTFITAYTQSTHTLSIAGPWIFGYPTGNYGEQPNDRYLIYDKLESITGSGQWAFDRLGGGRFRLYLWPAGSDSPSGHVVTVPNNSRFAIELDSTAYVVIDGLEVCHANGYGIGGWGGGTPTYLTIQNCCIHHNDGMGIMLEGLPNVLVYHNYIGYNGGGVTNAGASNVTIRENEICFNSKQDGSNDGVDLTGPDPGNPTSSNWAYGCVVDHNYIHDHTYWYMHPDSMQSYSNVYGALLENNFCVNSGQSYMMEQMTATTLSNNIWAQCAGYMLHDCDYVFSTSLQHCTLANAGWGNMSNAGNPGYGYSFHNTIFYLGHAGSNLGNVGVPNGPYSSDYNLFYSADGVSQAYSPVVYISMTGTKWNWTWAQYLAGSGQDAHSIYTTTGNPQFVNAPAWFSQLDGGDQAWFTPSRVLLENNELSSYAVGDHVEIDHDGVQRVVTGLGTLNISGTTMYYVTFTPSDARIATGAQMMCNWKSNTNYVVNYMLKSTSPAKGKASDGGDIGSSINVPQMMMGDFNGDGVRDVPTWPYVTPSYALTVIQTLGGSLTVTPSQALYGAGTTATVTAYAQSGYAFAGWTVSGGTISPYGSPATLTILGSVTLSASFSTQLSYTATEQATTGGTILMTSGGPYTYGQVVGLTASAVVGWQFSGWSATGAALSSSATATSSLTVLGNWTLTASFSPIQYNVMVPLNISGGFNMEAWIGPLMYQNCELTGSRASLLFGREPQGLAENLAPPYGGELLAGDDPAPYPPYSISSDWFHPANFSGTTCTPVNGLLTDPNDGRTYYIASLAGNALLPGDWLETAAGGMKNNSIVIGQYHSLADWSVSAVTFAITPSQYKDMNFVLAAGTTHGAAFMQIIANYSDSSTQVLYDFGDPGFATGTGFAGPSFTGSGPATFTPIYTTGDYYDDGSDGTGIVRAGSCVLYVFSTPLAVNPNKTLVGFTIRDLHGGSPNYNNYARELAVFAAAASLPLYSVTVNQTPGGAVTVSPSIAQYGLGAQMMVTAAANPGYRLISWSVTGGTVSPNAAQAVLTVQGNVMLSASFSLASFTSTEQSTGGTIQLTSSGPYFYGQAVGISATANPGWCFISWSATGATLSSSTAATASLTVLDNWTLVATFAYETFTITASTPSNWVYQNTPLATKDRHVLPLSITVTADTWGNHSYSTTVIQAGSGVVIPTPSWANGVLVTPTTSATWGGLSGYLVGGRRSDGVANTGACTLTIQVIGDVSTAANPASTSLTISVRPLGDIDGSGQVTPNDLAILNTRLNVFAIAPYSDANCDLNGDEVVTTADRVLLRKILNELAVP